MNETSNAALAAGCSALAWDTGDGRHLWGRNLDFHALADGTAVTYLPRGTAYASCAGSGGGCRSRYAALGVGLLLGPDMPLLYEGVNERGLMGGQLYYRGFARYRDDARPGTLPLQPPMAVYHLLAQCATVAEAAQALCREATLVGRPLLGEVPPLHWCFRDRTGETLVVEPDEAGIRLHRASLGVMTNSPGYDWHRLNLLNYAAVRDAERPGPDLAGGPAPCFTGSGAQGLPGDWSSPSRFVRLTFLRRYAVPGRDEETGVARMFRLLQSAAFPLGMVRLDGGGTPAYDHTLYTAVLCAESGRCYWTTYDNQQIAYAELPQLLERDAPVQFPLGGRPAFVRRTGGVPPRWVTP